jgi:hypothetical protein
MSEKIERLNRPWACPDCKDYVVGDHACPVSGRSYLQTIAGERLPVGSAVRIEDGKAYKATGSERMTKKIEPALSAVEWRTGDLPQYPSLLGDITYVDEPASIAAIIAVANRQLPDSDLRKITREMVEAIRKAYLEFGQTNDTTDRLLSIADALESYLPPE